MGRNQEGYGSLAGMRILGGDRGNRKAGRDEMVVLVVGPAPTTAKLASVDAEPHRVKGVILVLLKERIQEEGPPAEGEVTKRYHVLYYGESCQKRSQFRSIR